jgi:hypothetical protein
VEVPWSQTNCWLRRTVGATLCVSALVLWLSATPARAIVVSVGGHTYGVTPIKGVTLETNPQSHRLVRLSAANRTGPGIFDGPPEGGGPLIYNGGPVMHTVVSHVIYWDPGGEFTLTTKGIIGKFFTDVGHDSGQPSNVLAVGGQYSDTTGRAVYSASFGGAASDTNAYPASGCSIPAGLEIDAGPPYTRCITDGQLTTQLSEYISAQKLPTGPTQQYFVLLPHKVVTCLKAGVCSNNVYCAYHSVIGSGPEEVIYSDIPFSLLDSENVKGCQDDGNGSLLQHPNGDVLGSNANTRYADVALKYISHEYAEAATDPLANAYYDARGLENGDKCNGVHGSGNGIGYDPNSFLPVLGGEAFAENLYNQSINADHYYIQSEWDNAAKACTMRPVPISGAGFTAEPASGAPGSPISFKGAATDIYGGVSFLWKWGDGTESAGSAPTHTYAATGSYEVTMTPKDEFMFLTGTPVVHTVAVKLAQAIAFTSTIPSAAIVGGTPYNVSAVGGASGNPVTFSINPGSGGICTISGATVSFIGAGTCTVNADQAGNGAYNAAPQAHQSFAVAAQPVTPGPSGTGTGGGLVQTAPNSGFTAGVSSFDPNTGTVSFTESVADAGTFSWLLTFQNGTFGAFVSIAKCKTGFVRLGGRCRPSKIVFAKGSRLVAAPGTVTLKLKPSASALKALKSALRQKKGLPVTATFTFQSSRGGSPVSHTQKLTVKLRKR